MLVKAFLKLSLKNWIEDPKMFQQFIIKTGKTDGSCAQNLWLRLFYLTEETSTCSFFFLPSLLMQLRQHTHANAEESHFPPRSISISMAAGQSSGWFTPAVRLPQTHVRCPQSQALALSLAHAEKLIQKQVFFHGAQFCREKIPLEKLCTKKATLLLHSIE